ncbi:hypothetical protein [Streptomyces sp. R08]|uniref:Uncharacterized protein n=1 Tax=Streptomyces sp. R08 TaxID=3238624 RepID=A0AB39MFN3_9ACTN
MSVISLDGPLEPAEEFAARVDAWRIAYALLYSSSMRLDVTPEDVLDLARFVADA